MFDLSRIHSVTDRVPLITYRLSLFTYGVLTNIAAMFILLIDHHSSHYMHLLTIAKYHVPFLSRPQNSTFAI